MYCQASQQHAAPHDGQHTIVKPDNKNHEIWHRHRKNITYNKEIGLVKFETCQLFSLSSDTTTLHNLSILLTHKMTPYHN